MKVKYEGGQVLTDAVPGLKKTRFSFIAVLFFIFCAVSGGAFGIESIIPASGPGLTLVLLVVIPLMWALPMGLYVSELTNLAPVDSGPYVWGSTIDYSSVLFTHVGKWAGVAFMITAVISQLALVNATTATASRSFMVLGRDHLCPKFLSTVTKNKKVPIWPILILAVLNVILVNLDFEILVIILSPLLFVCYVGFAVAFLKLRKLYPVEKRGDLYYVKGRFSPYYIVISMLFIGLVGILMNGTEYFLLGYVLILFALFMYIICKKVYGGLSVENPVLYPVNPKTGLGKGDTVRFGKFFLIFGALALGGSFFLRWYEKDWGHDYYLDLYGSGLMSNWELMITLLTWIGSIMLVLSILLHIIGKKADPIPDDE